MFDNTLIFDSPELATYHGAITNNRDSEKVIEQVSGSSDYSKMWLTVIVKEDFATLTSLNIALVEANNKGLESGGSNVVKTLFSKEVALADLKAGNEVVKVRLPLPELHKGDTNGHTFLGIKYTVTGSNATAGKVVAGLVDAVNTSSD